MVSWFLIILTYGIANMCYVAVFSGSVYQAFCIVLLVFCGDEEPVF